MGERMNFNYDIEECIVNQRKIRFRAYRNLIYVQNPILNCHRLNLYVPLQVQEVDLKNTAIFIPNSVGGYLSGKIMEPGLDKHGHLNSIFLALEHGYIVVSPFIRGREQRDLNNRFIGKAPACIVDYKAVIRFLRYYDAELPGNKHKIIVNGTSAGGALSALLGCSANHPDYDSYLEKIGAYPTSDAVFASSCYCPITNLEHQDMAYEWQFNGIYDYFRKNMKMDEAGRPTLSNEDGKMNADQIQFSKDVAKEFIAYLNRLHLQDLYVEKNGKGSFKEYLKKLLIQSAQKELNCPAKRTRQIDSSKVTDKEWIQIENGKVIDLDFDAYIQEITRMKTALAFDSVDGSSGENDLFGNEDGIPKHFTSYSQQKSSKEELEMADEEIIRMMNPMNYISDEQATKAQYFRIRHGTCDRDGGLAIPTILALKLKKAKIQVDYKLPWNIPHAGDYDLEELFLWIDEICR